MVLKAIIAVDDAKGRVRIVGWEDAKPGDLRDQIDEDMAEAGHTASRHYVLDIAVPGVPNPTVMRLDKVLLG